jgi:hypothetical protein
MMHLQVQRFEYGTNYTLGRFFINGQYACFTLEDKVRQRQNVPVEQWKVKGETAIPTGTYKVIVDFSTRFNNDMPHVLDVPGFEGIRIHPGNTDKDTEGCILLGNTWVGSDFIRNSRMAFAAFYPKLQEAIKNGEDVTLEII